MAWMSDDCIDAALEIACDSCGVDAWEECVSLSDGVTPLVDEIGCLVHAKRVGAW